MFEEKKITKLKDDELENVNDVAAGDNNFKIQYPYVLNITRLEKRAVKCF